MPEKPASSSEQLDWLTFDLLAGTVLLDERTTDALAAAEQLLQDVKSANERFAEPEN